MILPLEPSGYDICQDTNSSFHGFRCPESNAGADGVELVATKDMTLQADHFGPITIGANDVTLNCGGHSIIGSGKGSGITIDAHRNVTIADCSVFGFGLGIDMRDTTDSTLIGNEAEANFVGYSLIGSDRNTLRDNSADFNETGFWLLQSDGNLVEGNSTRRGLIGIRLGDADENTVQDNEVTKSLTYGIELANGNRNLVSANLFLLVGSWGSGVNMAGANNELTANRVEGGNHGLVVDGESNLISQNAVDGSLEGITIGGSGHDVADNVVESARYGVVVNGSDNAVYRNTVRGRLAGPDQGGTAFRIHGADSNTLENNRAEDLRYGFGISQSEGNTFTGNDATAAEVGISGDAVTADNTFRDNLGFGLSEPLIVTEDLRLDADHDGTITLAADGITLDCDGHQIVALDWAPGNQLKRTEVGIQLRGHTGVTIENCQLVGYAVGVGLSDADSNLIQANTANITLKRSNKNRILDNTASGITLERSRRNIVRANAVTGVLELDKARRTTVEGNTAGTIRLNKAHRNVVNENTLDGEGGGVFLSNSDENTVADNAVVNGRFRLSGNSNTITGNSVDTARKYAFLIGQTAGNNLITDNVASNAPVGFRIYNSTSNTLRGNRAVGNDVGFQIRESSNNTFESNDATGATIPLEVSRDSEGRNTFTDNLGF